MGRTAPGRGTGPGRRPGGPARPERRLLDGRRAATPDRPAGSGVRRAPAAGAGERLGGGRGRVGVQTALLAGPAAVVRPGGRGNWPPTSWPRPSRTARHEPSAAQLWTCVGRVVLPGRRRLAVVPVTVRLRSRRADGTEAECAAAGTRMWFRAGRHRVRRDVRSHPAGACDSAWTAFGGSMHPRIASALEYARSACRDWRGRIILDQVRGGSGSVAPVSPLAALPVQGTTDPASTGGVSGAGASGADGGTG